ncbi:COG1361 family protein [Nocardiopsis potens]|uniref:DUF11 domain-containing protein n=1 Tax=Nocardiopsis potens TaxID=1246458 RepID=UPI00034B1E2C|nr:DUF11 domain-containing protein [Nocardiopsis potens]
MDVTDGVDRLEPGGEAEYVVTLRNEGGEAVEDVLLYLTLAPELELVETDGERPSDSGRPADGVAFWRVDLEPGESATGRVTGRLDSAEGAPWRVATTACAGLDRDAPPLACATDADLRPDPAKAGAAAVPSGPARPGIEEAVVGGASIALLAVGAVGYALWRRRELKKFDEGW